MITDTDRLLLVYVTDWHRKRQKNYPFKKFYEVQNIVCGCNHRVRMLDEQSVYEIRTQWVQNGCITFLYGRQDFVYVLYPLCICQWSGTGPYISVSDYFAYDSFRERCPSRPTYYFFLRLSFGYRTAPGNSIYALEFLSLCVIGFRRHCVPLLGLFRKWGMKDICLRWLWRKRYLRCMVFEASIRN